METQATNWSSGCAAGKRKNLPARDATRVLSRVPRWKRVLDLTLILLSLPVWWPIMVLVGVWIKIVSPGPLFFRQERVGFRGKRFMILKFRSMRVNAETQTHESHFDTLVASNRPMTKLDVAGDPRLIPGGRILRATGLDELPQLFNVIRNEMSLVGPRPCTLRELAKFQDGNEERFNAPPGLTGYWQVNGKNKTTFTEMMNLDIYYARNMSLRLDMSIILRTLSAIAEQVRESRVATPATQPVVNATATRQAAAPNLALIRPRLKPRPARV